MEILAIYVEDFGCFKKTLIPFSSEYKIKLERLGRNHFEYTITKNENYFNVFEPKINSLTGIIGENGSGKSTIAKILRVISSNTAPSNTIIYFFRLNNDTIYAENYLGDKLMDKEHQVVLNPEKEFSIIVDEKYLNENINAFTETNTKLVFYSSLLSGHNELIFDYNSRQRQPDLINLSIDHELRESLSINKIKNIAENGSSDFFDPFSGYYWQKLNKILKFLVFLYDPSNKSLFSRLEKFIIIPPEIYINVPHTIGLDLEKIEKRWNLNIKENVFRYLYKRIIGQKSNIREKFNFSYLIGLLGSEVLRKNINLKEFSEYLNNLEQFTSIENLIRSINNKLKGLKVFDEILAKYEKFIEEFQNQDTKTEDIIFRIDILSVTEKTFSFLKSVQELSDRLNFSLINYRWGYFLSSGEEAILNQFASYHSKMNEYKNSNNIYVIDEGELYLHPQWQKAYLNLLIIFINYIKQKDCKVQLIITSHSPFIVSDIPSDNLLFLVREDDECKIKTDVLSLTFGANIHSLFKNSFFLNDGFIGEYAKNKIENLIRFINKEESEENWTDGMAEKLIKIIGEPLIKDRLQNMYNEKNKTRNEILREISSLQDKLKKIENEENKD